MDQQSTSKKFVFNEKIDNAFIFNLYEDDYEYITEVFTTSLETFDADLDEVERAFKTGDLEALKKAVHKMKPVFGFCGLVSHQEKIARFEKACTLVTGTGFIASDYDEILQVLGDGKFVIQEELKRLSAFIK